LGCRAGSLAIRTGQLRSTCPGLTRSRRCSRIVQETLVQARRGSAPHGTSSDGPPAPHRLEQPSPCTSPISDVLRHQRGHRPLGSRTEGQLAEPPSCDERLAFTYVDQDPHPKAPCGAMKQRSGRLPSCHTRPGCPGRQPRTLPFGWKRSSTCAPFSPRSRRHVRQHVLRSAPWPASRRRLALRLTGRRNARCVGPTSAISLLRTSTRASLVLLHRALARQCNRGVACSTTVRFASAGCTSPLYGLIVATGVVFPS
jgi:hypothetical protein